MKTGSFFILNLKLNQIIAFKHVNYLPIAWCVLVNFCIVRWPFRFVHFEFVIDAFEIPLAPWHCSRSVQLNQNAEIIWNEWNFCDWKYDYVMRNYILIHTLSTSNAFRTTARSVGPVEKSPEFWNLCSRVKIISKLNGSPS